MRYRLAGCAMVSMVTAASCLAQVVIKDEGNGKFAVTIDRKPFGDFYTSKQAPKPYFSPLRTADGKIVTREWPMVPNSGTTRDHQHHRGLWIGYIDVNGTNFWENEYSYGNKSNKGTIVAKDVKTAKASDKAASIHGTFAWMDKTGKEVLTEDRTMTFRAEPRLRIVDLDVTLTASTKAVFADDKDGAVGVRMADTLTEKSGNGTMTNSLGEKGMDKIWGKKADWCDYSGTLDAKKVGLLMMEHPTSFHHPTRWHARDYGLLSANPFADHAYDPSAPERKFSMEPGQSIRLRYRIVLHGDLGIDAMQKLYKDYSAEVLAP
jgi:hypothetical protein